MKSVPQRQCDEDMPTNDPEPISTRLALASHASLPLNGGVPAA